MASFLPLTTRLVARAPLSLAVLVAGFAVTAGASSVRAEAELSFGVYTTDKPTTMVRLFRPALNALEKRVSDILGRPLRIRLQVARSYEAGLSDLVEGRVDFSRFGPASYVMAKRADPGISILAVESNGGTRVFYGIICVHEDSGITDVAQLRGRSFAFGDDNSTIGRFLAQLFLMENGIRASALSRFEYLGRHDRVGAAVGLGQFDAGALKDNTFSALVENGVPIREIARFPNTTKPWIARSGLAEPFREALREALLSLDPEAVSTLSKDGFLPGRDSDYDTIRRALARNGEFFKKAPAHAQK